MDKNKGSEDDRDDRGEDRRLIAIEGREYIRLCRREKRRSISYTL